MVSTTSTTSTSLHGPWLLVMRLTWLLLAIFVFGMVIIALPGAYQNYAHASPALNQDLRLRGLPANWQVFYFLGWHFVAMLAFGVVAYLSNRASHTFLAPSLTTNRSSTRQPQTQAI